MKRTLPILSIAVLITTVLLSLTACQSKKAPDSLVLSAKDTSGLAEFQSWKSMNEAKAASNFYIQGYKDAMATKPATKTTVVHKAAPAVARTTTAQPVKKKGWSKAAKGTAVGTAAGAIAGVLINKKNRVAGGVIGGILGGGIGYGVGRGMDKKDGRF
ncbi:MAG: glycine zipper 2TM domain-containing protein [Chitinophagales bacterium]